MLHQFLPMTPAQQQSTADLLVSLAQHPIEEIRAALLKSYLSPALPAESLAQRQQMVAEWEAQAAQGDVCAKEHLLWAARMFYVRANYTHPIKQLREQNDEDLAARAKFIRVKPGRGYKTELANIKRVLAQRAAQMEAAI